MVVFTLFVIGRVSGFLCRRRGGGIDLRCRSISSTVRVVRLRPINLFMTLLWCAFGALALAQAALAAFYDQIGVLGEQVSVFTKIGISVSALYRACIGGIMQLFPTLGAKKA
jgi:phosphatidylcholine synthase